jgi:nucleotidyltransferase substrate binding protein (TIGR01987 family)
MSCAKERKSPTLAASGKPKDTGSTRSMFVRIPVYSACAPSPRARSIAHTATFRYTSRMDADIRWKQRLANFRKAFGRLDEAVLLSRQRDLSDLERQGLIQAFEFTHELAWNLMKDWFDYQGNFQISGSRDATREAFRMGLIQDGEAWMEMLRSRNQSSHTYNLETAAEMARAIDARYWAAFRLFLDSMDARAQQT